MLLKEGVFRYSEENHELIEIASDDIREHVGTQKMMKSAPLGLVYVADLSRMTGPLFRSDEARRFCAWVDTGYISQYIYLFCAASNLATAALALIKREKLRTLTQVVGHAL